MSDGRMKFCNKRDICNNWAQWRVVHYDMVEGKEVLRKVEWLCSAHKDESVAAAPAGIRLKIYFVGAVPESIAG